MKGQHLMIDVECHEKAKLEDKALIAKVLTDIPRMIGMTIGIYNGKTFNDVLISHRMLGHRLGEFSLTRTFRGHGKITKKVTEKT